MLRSLVPLLSYKLRVKFDNFHFLLVRSGHTDHLVQVMTDTGSGNLVFIKNRGGIIH